jgi:hypothetical protein
MRFPIRPGKVTCAGLVGVLLVLPANIWKDPEARLQPVMKPKKRVERHVMPRLAAHQSSGFDVTNPSM